jgi:phosphatidylserine/phosphatidylglycerophosphate/cardiolipin synthase-like enzyme
MKYIKILFLFTILNFSLFAKDEVYFLPNQSKDVKNQIEYLIKNANRLIDIAMYNFSYKKFAKLLKKAKKRGVEVNIIYEKSDIKLKSLDAIQHKDPKKLHTKLAIFDNKTVVFGSTNWTKKSFNENLEFVYITDNSKIVQKFITFFKRIK